jgi:hypothetical protein
MENKKSKKIETRTITVIERQIGSRDAFIRAVSETDFSDVVGRRAYLGFFPGARAEDAIEVIRRGGAGAIALVHGGMSLYL